MIVYEAILTVVNIYGIICLFLIFALCKQVEEMDYDKI